jgi:hypothetical protein
MRSEVKKLFETVEIRKDMDVESLVSDSRNQVEIVVGD